MGPVTSEQLCEALWQFGLGATCTARPCGAGHIHTTWLVQNSAQQRYILQRINTAVFADPAALMENICAVTGWLRKGIERTGGDPVRETLHVCPTRAGAPFWQDGAGNAWRVYDFIPGTVCLQRARGPADLRAVGLALGQFQRRLAGYPAGTLHETIPRFHDTPGRWRALMDAACTAGPCRGVPGRARLCRRARSGLPCADRSSCRRRAAAAGDPQRYQAQQRAAGPRHRQGTVRDRP